MNLPKMLTCRDVGPEEGAGEDVVDSSESGEEIAENEAEIRKEEEAIAARLANEKARETRRADAVKHQKVRITYPICFLSDLL